MAIFEGMPDAELDAQIASMRTSYLEVMTGGGVSAVRGEGRAIEYTRANVRDLLRILQEAIREKARRDPNYQSGNALLVEF